MPPYFEKKEEVITYPDFAILCIRMAAEAFGFPTIDPYGEKTLEFSREK